MGLAHDTYYVMILFSRLGMGRLLSTPEKAQATARWFVQQEILQQFNLAKDIEEEEAGELTPFDLWKRTSKTFRKYGNNGLY